MDLASAEAEIRHVFGDTPITEASIGAAPPGNNIAQWFSGCQNSQLCLKAMLNDIVICPLYSVQNQLVDLMCLEIYTNNL